MALLAGRPHAHPQDEQVEDDHGQQTDQVNVPDKIHPREWAHSVCDQVLYIILNETAISKDVVLWLESVTYSREYSSRNSYIKKLNFDRPRNSDTIFFYLLYLDYIEYVMGFQQKYKGRE